MLDVTCDECGAALPLKALQSAAGWYVGRQCPNCGPYDRNTGYYATKPEAEVEIPGFLALEADCGEPSMSMAGDF